MHLPRTALLWALLPLLFLAACTPPNTEKEREAFAGAAKKHELIQVRAEPALRREMVEVLRTTTNVESRRRVAILPQASGPVVEILAEEGDAVEEGALLARLDARDAEVALEKAGVKLTEAQNAVVKAGISKREAEGQIEGTELSYANARAVYERNQGEGLVSAQELDKLKLDKDRAWGELDKAKLLLERSALEMKEAETSVRQARLDLQTAELSLSHTALRAPFEGVISERGIRLGENISGTTEAFVITDLNDLRAVFYRPQRELGIFSPAPAESESAGLGAIEVKVLAEAVPGVEFRGEIERVSPDIDPDSGSFRISVKLPRAGDGPHLLPGMLVRLEVVTDRHPDALVVSKRALRREGETRVVYVIREGVARRVEVLPGFTSDDLVEVTPIEGSSLEEGELAIVVGNRDLEDGDEVELVEEVEPPAEEAAAASEGEAQAAPEEDGQ